MYLFVRERLLERDPAVRRVPVDPDLPELHLVLVDVVLQGTQQQLRMLRGHDDTRMNLGLGDPGKHPGEIDDELSGRMGDDGEV